MVYYEPQDDGASDGRPRSGIAAEPPRRRRPLELGDLGRPPFPAPGFYDQTLDNIIKKYRNIVF